MKPELPKSVRRALGQTQSVTAHLSADLLTAFAEQALPADEKERVAHHLAACRECREVVYLASNAEEHHAPETNPTKGRWQPRPRWMAMLAKTIFVASGLVIVAGIFLRIYVDHQNSTYKMSQVAQVARQDAPNQRVPSQPPPQTSEPETSNSSTIRAEVARPPQTQKMKPSQAGPVSSESELGKMKAAPPAVVAKAQAPAEAVASQPKPVNQPPGTVVAGPINNLEIAAPTQNSFGAQQERSKVHAFAPSHLSDSSQVSLRAGGAASKTWRITPEGHLEHLSQTGWMSVLADQPTKFHVVAESPNGVWAGGSKGELFHSEDGGAHWSKVTLAASPDRENDAIVEIHFADLQHGVIVTGSGTRYSTSDAGKSWQQQ